MVVTDGIILIDKPAGLSSFGVVARIRRVLGEQASRKVKVGHTGTLDPFATGLMILVVGKECREAGRYAKLDKEYEAVIRLGQVSTTGDPEGELSEISPRRPERSEIEAALEKFTGEISQTPPAYSAIKVGGRRAYDIARRGGTVEIPARKVTVYSLELLDYSYPDVTIRAGVSSGTYIRSLAADIGAALGTGAYCAALRRVSIADWKVEDARTLADFGISS